MTGALNLPANGLIVGTDQLAFMNGRVGIRTASPEDWLHVVAAGGLQGITIQAADNAALAFKGNSGYSSITGGDAGNSLYMRPGGTRPQIWYTAAAQVGSIAAHADAANTLNPAASLFFRSRYWNGTASLDHQATIRHILETTAPTSRLGLFVGGNTELLTVNSGGNIGIGIINPSERLHVNGTLSIGDSANNFKIYNNASGGNIQNFGGRKLLIHPQGNPVTMFFDGVPSADFDVRGSANFQTLKLNSPNTARKTQMEFHTKNNANGGGVYWIQYADADTAVIGDRKWSLWGYLKRTTDGSTYAFEPFITAEFPTANDTTYTKRIALAANDIYLAGKVGIGTSVPIGTLDLYGGDPTIFLRNNDEAPLGFIMQTYASIQFGLNNRTTAAVQGIGANQQKPMFVIHMSGKVGTVSNTSPGSPSFRNVLDDGTGAATIAGAINASGGVLSPQDVEVTDAAKGMILKSPNGTRYRLTVSDAGSVVVIAV